MFGAADHESLVMQRESVCKRDPVTHTLARSRVGMPHPFEKVAMW